jgi:hypothetical protein
MTREVLAAGAGTALGMLPCTGLNLNRLGENALRTSCGHPGYSRDGRGRVGWWGGARPRSFE